MNSRTVVLDLLANEPLPTKALHRQSIMDCKPYERMVAGPVPRKPRGK